LAEQLRLADQAFYVFLDSQGSDLQQGRYAILGQQPWFECRSKDGSVLVNGLPTTQDIWSVTRDFLKSHAADDPAQALPPEIPFHGGLVGYFSYDLAVLETAGAARLPEAKDHDLPDAWLVAFDQMVVLDRLTSTACLLAWGRRQDPDQAISQLKTAVQQAEKTSADRDGMGEEILARPGPSQSFWAARSNFLHDAYCQRITQVRRAIGEGDVYILNLAQRFLLPESRNLWQTYRRLSAVSPTPFAACCQFGPARILSFSPELLLRVRGRTVSTRPIKGTRPRGQTPHQDHQYRQALLHSEKDRAELLMIVDLERNDLSRICTPDSVRVSELYGLESYATVHHLVATVEGELAVGEDAVSALRALFPGGSITGAPKLRAMQLISDFEPLRRGLYTGSLGYFSLDGQAGFSILIRTICSDGHRTTYHAGGGITWDSDPEAEYQETLDKARAIGGVFHADSQWTAQ
jgi:para-aminobenzoate synthetase component 1